jgi:hypothetical protein
VQRRGALGDPFQWHKDVKISHDAHCRIGVERAQEIGTALEQYRRYLQTIQYSRHSNGLIEYAFVVLADYGLQPFQVVQGPLRYRIAKIMPL